MQGIRKLGTLIAHVAEVTPFEYHGELLMLESIRILSPNNSHNGEHYLRIIRLADGTRDVENTEEYAACEILTEFAMGYTFGVPFVDGDTIYVYATLAEYDDLVAKPEVDDIHVFWSDDLTAWNTKMVVQGVSEQVFNTSVCRANDRFVMAYETNDKTWNPFTIRFAESDDLLNWRKIPAEKALYGPDRYTACPAFRWMDGQFYLYCLEMPREGEWWFEEYAARSSDLLNWEMSPVNPILAPEPDGSEDINTSDIDFCEFDGKTIIYYAWSNQRGNGYLAHAVFDGTEREFLLATFCE
jgi:hypothetical protein